MFRSLNKDNAENIVYIQGARSKGANSNIASLIFQNYDNDSKTVYSMASISVRDHFACSNIDGFGDLVFNTRDQESLQLTERLFIANDGNIGIGTLTPKHKLEIMGDVCSSKMIQAPVIETCHLIVKRLEENGANIARSDLNCLSSNIYNSLAKTWAMELVNQVEPKLCDSLNQYLQNTKFGPFAQVNDYVYKLLQLKRCEKLSKAQELNGLLESFATLYGGSIQSFMEWSTLIRMKNDVQRDPSPVDVTSLEVLLTLDSELANVQHAIKLILNYIKALKM